jgi:hypothetical protein
MNKPVDLYEDLTLKQILKDAEETSSNWNGKESGYQEEMAGYAEDIIEKVAELKELLSAKDEF